MREEPHAPQRCCQERPDEEDRVQQPTCTGGACRRARPSRMTRRPCTCRWTRAASSDACSSTTPSRRTSTRRSSAVGARRPPFDGVVGRHARFPRRVRPGLRQGLRARVRGRRDGQLLGQPVAAPHGRPLGLDAPKMLVQDRGRPARQDDLRHGVRRRAAASKSTARPRFVDATSSQSPVLSTQA